MAEAAAAAEAEAASEGAAAAGSSQEDATRIAPGDAPASSAANGTAQPPGGVPGAADQAGHAAGHDSDSDVVCVDEDEGDTAHSGYSGFYRASRETGRANILLALQVGRPRLLTLCQHCSKTVFVFRAAQDPSGTLLKFLLLLIFSLYQAVTSCGSGAGLFCVESRLDGEMHASVVLSRKGVLSGVR